MRCFITGATGFVGSHLAEACLERGWDVSCLVRSPDRPGWLTGTGVKVVHGDLDDIDVLARAIDGTDVVFHLAALVKARAVEDYERVNCQGTDTLVRACLLNSKSTFRLIVLSSQAAAGPSLDGTPIDEDMPCNPVSPYGWSKLRSEHAALSRSDALATTVIRPPTIYGPRDREGLAIFRLVAVGVRPRLAVREISIIHVRDLVEAILAAGTTEAAAGRTYFVANENPVTLTDVGSLMARSLGRKTVEIPISSRLLWTAGLANEMGGRLLGKEMIFDRHKAIEMVQTGWVCSSARAIAELPWRPRIDLAIGLDETVRWYRANTWL
ncbi:MAG TPA: NAD(P)-dependent oxidoreductase [Chloroflexota bacterium]|nr:NAD(P)-dependent oxidoreductase [Chloroflexota bacterium]